MIPLKPLLSTCLILLTSICYGQTLTDSSICITHHQAKVINLAFNELTRMINLDSVSKEQLGTKDLKIAQLQKINQLRSDQLSKSNQQVIQLEQDLKRLRVKIVAYKIAIALTSLGLIVSLL
jgi:hypothetical protein